MDFRHHRRSDAKSKGRVRIRRRLVLEHLVNRRVLAAITGTVFEDLDHSYRQEPAEQSLAGRLVYLDINENEAIDTGEPYALSDDAGGFVFTGLPDGQYQVRLYDGSDTQTQVTPVVASRSGAAILMDDAVDLSSDGSQFAVLDHTTLRIGDFDDGTFTNFVISQSPSAVEQLPGGNYLVVGGNGLSQSAWLADPYAKTLRPIDLTGDGSAVVWSDVVIDENGHGVLLQQTDNATVVLHVDASDPNAKIEVTDRGLAYPTDTQVLASQAGNRSVVAWAGQWTDANAGDQSGLQVSLWSNANGSPISLTPANLAGTTELLDYDDVSGLVALRMDDGGVSVYDANANFALLAALPEVTGPVAIDGQRDLLVAMSANASTIELFDAHKGSSIAQLAIDVADLGTINTIKIQRSDSLVLLGSKGTSRVSLTTPASNHVTLVAGNDSDPISFGVVQQGENSLPQFSPSPTLSTNEDQPIYIPAPGLLQIASDANQDDLVVLLTAPPVNGTAMVGVDGSLQYIPNLNFNGVDFFSVMLHDGRGSSGVVTVTVDVIPVDDPPEILLEVDEIAENIPPGTVVGSVEFFDPDEGDENEFFVDDIRFEIIDGQLVFVGLGVIDFESEPTIMIGIYDAAYSSSLNQEVPIGDENDPIIFIEPDEAGVYENDFGAPIEYLWAYDEDVDDTHTFTVDDDRFIVEESLLMLVPGVALDYEAEQTVTINVTATDGTDSLTEPIVIEVYDEVEQPIELALSNETVVELTPGAEVGDVIVDGNPLSDGYTASVDDARFEIDGSTLKLVDDQSVDRAEQEEIELTISVQDKGGLFASASETFVISVIEKSDPSTNDSNPFDVDGSGEVTPLDALIIINYINEHGVGEVADLYPGFNLDVNRDGFITPLDILLVLNELQAIQEAKQGGTVNGEPSGELSLPIELITDSNVKDHLSRDRDEWIDGELQQTLRNLLRRLSLSPNQLAAYDNLLSDRHVITSPDSESETTAKEFADGVDASLDSLLDEMS